jgi:hypothetical protein
MADIEKDLLVDAALRICLKRFTLGMTNKNPMIEELSLFPSMEEFKMLL